jgi:transglutaminase-like putative cysteine protease
MWLTIEHTTRLTYDAPIAEAYTELRLKPIHDDGQRCSAFTITTEPRNLSISEYDDRFGNVVHHFDILEPHDRLVLTVRSEVWTPSLFIDTRHVSEVDRWDFLHPSRCVPLDGAIDDLASSVTPATTPAETAIQLLGRVRDAMTYEVGSTHVHTRADEALADGRGVCQDFAHVLIGVCRVHAIPARYVSGYLYDPSRDGEHEASHAWVDVLDPDRGWISLDPTHDGEQTDHYVRIGVGRDYADVPPTRGVYKGPGVETLDVSVHISEPGAYQAR